MSEQEKTAINQRVAIAMGWTAVRETERDVYRGSVLGFTTVPVTVGISPHAGGNAGMPKELLDYCGHPAAADLVRQEIERRGWDVLDYNEIHNGTRQYQCYIRRDAEEYLGTGDSANSPHEALCLAFLAAVDAQEAKP